MSLILASGWFSRIEISCSMEVQQVLLSSRKISVCTTYWQKWMRFIHWCSCHYLQPELIPLSLILDYLLDLKTSGLFISSVKVPMATISVFHTPVEGFSIFTHPVLSRFIKALDNLFPNIRHPTPLLHWDLNLVFNHTIRPPFEPIAICSLLHLSTDRAFLVAIMSASRLKEIGALMADPPLYHVIS